MKRDSDTLAETSASASEIFLKELANLRSDSIARFDKRYGKMIPTNDLPPAFQSQFDDIYKRTTGLDTRGHDLVKLRDLIRRLWLEPDLRTREYILFELRRNEIIAGASLFEYEDYILLRSLPPPSEFERALAFLHRKVGYTRFCGNPNCPAPYFFARRRSQRFCQDACAAPAQREFKRQWWSEHGEEWRAVRASRKGIKKRRK